MEKKKGKKVKNQGSSVNCPNKKIVKELKWVKNKLKTMPSEGSPSKSKLPYVTPTTIMTSSIVAHDNAGMLRRNQYKECTEQTPGFIFMCNGRTKPECYRYRVFGLPTGNFEIVKKIKPGTKLFLFDFDLKLLYGVYDATSEGQLGLEPNAFNGKFPIQVKFKIFKECLPLPERVFKEAIWDNYRGSKFRQDLSDNQVKILVDLFRPITAPPSATAANTMTNVVAPHWSQAPIADKRFQPPPYGSYSPGIPHGHALPVPFYQSEQVIPHPSFDQYQSKTYAGSVQPPVGTRNVVQQAADPHPSESNYLTEAQQPYLSENSSLHILDSYGRYRHNLEVAQSQSVQVPGCTFQLAGNIEIGRCSQNEVNYYSQNLPPGPALSHGFLQTNLQGEPSQNVVSYCNQNPPPASASSCDLVRTTAQEHSQDAINYYGQNMPAAPALLHGLLHTKAQGEHSENMVNYYSPNVPPAPASSDALAQTDAQGELLSSCQAHYPVTTNEASHRAYTDPLQGRLSASTTSLVQGDASLPYSCYNYAGAAPTYR